MTDSKMTFMVLEDPNGRLRAGEELEETLARRASLEGVALIPVDPGTFGRSAIAGFFRRDWGEGWEVSRAGARPLCPMALFLHGRQSKIHWRARVAVPPDLKGLTGVLRLASDSSQAGHGPVGLSGTGFDLGKLHEADPRRPGALVVGGWCDAHAVSDGFYGFSLWGEATQALVQWSAISQVVGG